MLTDERLQGILIGFVLALGLGILGQYLSWSRDRISSFFEPQRVVHQTNRTPFQLFVGCLTGILALALLIFAVWFATQRLP